MKESKLISLIALLFVVNHFLTIILIVVLTIMGWFSVETLKISLSVITPIFVPFTTLILRFIFNNKNKKADISNGQTVNFLFAFVAIFIPFVFLAFLYFIIINQALHADSLENYVTYLGILETFFAVFTGYIIKSLFLPNDDPFENIPSKSPSDTEA